MKKWIKVFAVTGVVMVCAGTGITALAGVMGGGRIINMAGSGSAGRLSRSNMTVRLPQRVENLIGKVLGSAGGRFYFGENSLYYEDGWYDADGNWHDEDGWYDEQGNWHDDDGWYDADGNWHDDDGWYDADGNWHDDDGWYDADGNWHDEDGEWHAADSNAKQNYDSFAAGIMQEIDGSLTISSKEEMVLAATYGNVRELKLTATGGAVRIVENPELKDQIAVYYKEKAHTRVTHRTEDHPYEVEVEYSLQGVGTTKEYVEGIIEVPAGFRFDELEAEARGGIIEIPMVLAGELKLETNGGGISVTSFETDKLSVEANGGAISAEGSAGLKVEAETNAGAISLTLKGKKEDFNYKLDGEMGTVTVDGADGRAVAASQSKKTGAKKMELENTMGAIQIEFR